MRIHFSQQAVRDRRRLAAFLVDRNPPAALRAVTLISDGIAELANTPRMGHGPDAARELYIRFGDSGYVVQYRVDADVVVIARIFHMREVR